MDKEKPEIRTIGRCKLDVDAILAEMPEIIVMETSDISTDKYKKIWHSHYEGIYKRLDTEDAEAFSKAYSRTFSSYAGTHIYDLSAEQVLEKAREEFTKSFTEDLYAAELMHIEFKCYLQTESLSMISPSGETGSFWLIPSRFVKVEEYRDYSDLSGAERTAAINSITDTADIIVSGDMSFKDAVALKGDAQAALDSLKAEIEDVKESRTEELSSIQAEINRLTAELEAKKRSILDELDGRLREMNGKLEEMEAAVFKLDSEIYAIRCYTGEIAEVNQIRSGNAGKTDSPIVFYQKLRYLDEELGKIASLYNVDFSDAKFFEEILKCRDDVLNTFLPAQRSIALVRVSRSNKGYMRTEFPGLLKTYEKFHGKKVAILIRDGERLYLSWTDDDRINFSDDAFLRPMTRTAEEGEAESLLQRECESDDAYEKRIKKQQLSAIKESLGRYYVFALLQGMLDRGLIILPEKVKIADSKYIIFSMADGWLDNSRYGTFEDMISRCNASVKKGDHVLMTSSLWARSSEIKNDRGRGYADRTWDVSANDKEIYPVNLVEHIAHYSYVYEDNDKTTENRTAWRISDEEYKQKFIDSYYADRYSKIEMVSGTEDYRYYVSLLKQTSWSGTARANFEICKDEFINLTFMNSVWLKYVLTNNKLGKIRIGGMTVDFATVIPYLKAALKHVKDREASTLSQILEIDRSVAEDPEWPVKLSEWMLENDIHNFSNFRTKQFCRAYNEEKKRA